jgi:hypothetical protein
LVVWNMTGRLVSHGRRSFVAFEAFVRWIRIRSANTLERQLAIYRVGFTMSIRLVFF